MNPEISASHEQEELLLPKVFINVHLHSAQEKLAVADELSGTDWKVSRNDGVMKIIRSIDAMPTSQEMDILITLENVTEEEAQSFSSLVRSIQGVKSARWYKPVSHRE